MGGSAVVDAATKLKRKVAEIVAPILRSTPEGIRFVYGKVMSDNDDMTFEEAISAMYQQQQFPFAFGVFRAPRVSWNEENGQGDAYFTWVYGCQVAEVSVNPKTGKIKLINAFAVHDVGRAIHRSMLLGQFYGGVAMGAGYGLMEGVTSENGVITSTNYNSYRIPRATDLPDIHAIVLENYDPLSRSGAKGIGEPSNELMAPAIANAVYRATGKRLFQLPLKASPLDILVPEAAHANTH